MWMRKTIDVLVMTLLLLGPAVLLSKLDSTPKQDDSSREMPTEITDHTEPEVAQVEEWYF
jgi:hypothetical protein